MPGIKNPIKLSPMDTKRLMELDPVLRDLEFELNRMRLAGLDVTERAKELDVMKRRQQGIIKIYGTK